MRYILVNLFKSDWEGVEEISYDEFKEYVYFESNVKDMFDDVEVNDIGNGLTKIYLFFPITSSLILFQQPSNYHLQSYN